MLPVVIGVVIAGSGLLFLLYAGGRFTRYGRGNPQDYISKGRIQSPERF